MKSLTPISDSLESKRQLLKSEAIQAIKELLKDEFLFDLEENGFTDDAGNDIEAVSEEDIFFNGGETYPIHELSIEDAIYLAGVIEHMKSEQQAANEN